VTLIGAAVQLGAAAVLLVAAAAKLAVPREITATLTALGLRPVAVLRVALPLAELAAAVALAVAPAAPATRIGLGAMGLAFAAVGLRVHRRGEVVACACFGGRHGRALGLRQVAALPAWAAAAVLPAALRTPLAGEDGLRALLVVALATAVGAAVPLGAMIRQNRAYMAVVAR